MSLSDLFTNLDFIIGMKVVIFLSATTFATFYLIPKGIIHITKWKEKKIFSHLALGINFISFGIFIMLYFLAMFIIDSLKTTYR